MRLSNVGCRMEEFFKRRVDVSYGLRVDVFQG